MYSLANIIKGFLDFLDIILPLTGLAALPLLCIVFHSFMAPGSPFVKVFFFLALLTSAGTGIILFIIRNAQSHWFYKHLIGAVFAISTLYALVMALLLL